MLHLHSQDIDLFTQLDRYWTAQASPTAVEEAVRTILQEIRTRGETAVFEHSLRLDRVDFSRIALQVSLEELRTAAENLAPQQRQALLESIASIRSFHEKGIPQDWTGRNAHGAEVGERFYPLQRVGLYIPGGRAPLVSTVIMTATLARLAGVPEIMACTPCAPDGSIHTALLAALHLCGVTEVYRLGGAVAVGVMAFGTPRIAPVVKIFGPGGAYLNEAKRQVFGRIGIDLLAGPSEVMVIADATARADWVAADLLAQAEHDPRVRCVLIADQASLFAEVRQAIEKQIQTLSHRTVIEQVLAQGLVFIQVSQLSEAVAIANRLAPEHLEIHTSEENQAYLLQQITTAGAIFLGSETPTVLGDFVAGPNHTLPTAYTGKFLSGLRITDFYRRSSLTKYHLEALRRARTSVNVFSDMEQLDAHGRSLLIRLVDLSPTTCD